MQLGCTLLRGDWVSYNSQNKLYLNKGCNWDAKNNTGMNSERS